jgi:hypothetical protein
MSVIPTVQDTGAEGIEHDLAYPAVFGLVGVPGAPGVGFGGSLAGAAAGAELHPLLIIADWMACTFPFATDAWPSLSPPNVDDIGTARLLAAALTQLDVRSPEMEISLFK